VVARVQLGQQAVEGGRAEAGQLAEGVRSTLQAVAVTHPTILPTRQPIVQRVYCRNYNGQWGRHGRQTLVYAYWGVKPGSTRWVRETYRKRFAIETSYRQLHQGRARTSTRNPVVRLLLVGVALVLRNVWVWLHYAVLSTPRRGSRRYNWERLPLRGLLLWLQHQAEDELGRRADVAAERSMPQRPAG
jgi:hypothetical protein